MHETHSNIIHRNPVSSVNESETFKAISRTLANTVSSRGADTVCALCACVRVCICPQAYRRRI